MQLLLLCPQWGLEHLDLEDFIIRVKEAGYDGIDTWAPGTIAERRRLLRLLEEYKLVMVSHQHQAAGSGIDAWCRDFDRQLSIASELNPVLINSHSGRDSFTFDEQLQVIDTAAGFEERTGFTVAHETHRGRMGFCPGNFDQLLRARPAMRITADLSHWVCVTESYLEHFREVVDIAIRSTVHVHARVGFPEGPQVPDPRAAQYAEAWLNFTGWWTRIISACAGRGDRQLTITPEFGPPPYMWTNVADAQPVASQWDVNLYIREWFKSQFSLNSA